MPIHIQREDTNYEYVGESVLAHLIATRQIVRFFRPSEKRWIVPDVDPVRGAGGEEYTGPERRRS